MSGGSSTLNIVVPHDPTMRGASGIIPPAASQKVSSPAASKKSSFFFDEEETLIFGHPDARASTDPLVANDVESPPLLPRCESVDSVSTQRRLSSKQAHRPLTPVEAREEARLASKSEAFHAFQIVSGDAMSDTEEENDGDAIGETDDEEAEGGHGVAVDE